MREGAYALCTLWGWRGFGGCMHATSEQLQSYKKSSELEMKDANNWMSVKTPGSACPLTTCGQSNLHIDLDDCCCT